MLSISSSSFSITSSIFKSGVSLDFISSFAISKDSESRFSFRLKGLLDFNSEDSRFWGFVPYDHILGEASFIWFSYNYQEDNLFSAIRWNRFLKVIK